MQNELAIQTPTPLVLLEQAVAKGVDIAQLEKLMEMQERWEKKEAKKKFFEALSNFQTKVPALKKRKTAKVNSAKGNFQYKYADLGSIVEEIKHPLQECGLSYRWEFKDHGELIEATCLISHKDGHTETTSMKAGKDDSGAKNSIQQRGSTQTYLQRYTLIGALGLATADDDNDARNVQRKPAEGDVDYLDQWRDVVKQARSMTELTGLFMRNKKSVEGDEAIQKIFKDREAQLKQNTQTKAPAMP